MDFKISLLIATFHHITVADCLSCDILHGKRISIGGTLHTSKFFEVQQDYTVPIPGFLVIVSKRHIKSIPEFSQDELCDFAQVLYKTRVAMKEALAVEIVCIIQEEDAQHFHVWLFPQYSCMEQFGGKIASVKPILDFAKKHLTSDEHQNDVIVAIDLLKQSLKLLFTNKHD